jgi:putative selenate reductase
MFKCTRLDYDESLAIREMKKVAFDNAAKGAIEKLTPAPITGDAKVAIVGAGPAGLAAAWFLRKGGLSVTVMDKEKEAGGTVSHVIPEFRIPSETTMTDVEMIRKSGVEFKMGVDPNFSLDELKKEYNYVFLGLGACKENNIKLEASDADILNAITFLKDYKQGKAMDLGEHVVVAGAGNTAMDTARAATRISGVKDVSIVYRRTKKQMPADAEELELALEDGVLFKELLNPVSLAGGKLRCAVMELGEADESGRRRPVATGEFKDVDCTKLISSIGEKVDDGFLNGLGINTENGVPKISAAGETSVEGVYLGGDVRLGPSTVVKAIADATAAARDILSKEKIELDLSVDAYDLGEKKIWERKGNLDMQKDDASEGERCLGCQEVCEICMEVCPNRANVTVEIDGRGQIVHVDGMCNECGNCEIFCPYGGAPYKEKFTLFWSEADFVDSQNKGFLLLRDGDKPKFKIRLEEETVVEFDQSGKCDDASLDAGIASLIYQCYTDYSWIFSA